MLRFYLKRAVFIILIVTLAVGYSLWKERQESEALEKSRRYALIVAQLAMAEALHHDSDGGPSWQQVKDSLISSWSLNSDSIDAYVNSFEGHEEKLAAFWKRVRINVDSLTKLELANLSPPSDSVADSSQTKAVDTITTIPRK